MSAWLWALATAAVCPASVHVRGAEALEISDILRARGLRAPAKPCRATEVRVWRRGDTLRIDLRSPDDHRARRAAPNPWVAALVIDAWVRSPSGLGRGGSQSSSVEGAASDRSRPRKARDPGRPVRSRARRATGGRPGRAVEEPASTHREEVRRSPVRAASRSNPRRAGLRSVDVLAVRERVIEAMPAVPGPTVAATHATKVSKTTRGPSRAAAVGGMVKPPPANDRPLANGRPPAKDRAWMASPPPAPGHESPSHAIRPGGGAPNSAPIEAPPSITSAAQAKVSDGGPAALTPSPVAPDDDDRPEREGASESASASGSPAGSVSEGNRVRGPFRLGGRAEMGFDEDAGPWVGGLIEASLDLSLVSPRIALRGAYGGPATARSTTARADVELWAGLERPVRLGAFVLRPGLSAGAALSRGWRVAPACSEADCATRVRDGFSASSWRFRTEVHVVVSYAIAAEWALSVFGAASWQPSAGEAPITPEYADQLNPELAESLSLVPPPRLVVRFGLGAEWGGG